MKLRIRDNSLRLRLTRGEVDTLRKDGLVSARTRFPGGRELRYQIESSPASVSPNAHFSNGVISLSVPESVVLGWASSEQVSIREEQQLDNGDLLNLLIEKDFACLAPRDGEDDSDMFPNPNSNGADC